MVEAEAGLWGIVIGSCVQGCAAAFNEAFGGGAAGDHADAAAGDIGGDFAGA